MLPGAKNMFISTAGDTSNTKIPLLLKSKVHEANQGKQIGNFAEIQCIEHLKNDIKPLSGNGSSLKNVIASNKAHVSKVVPKPTNLNVKKSSTVSESDSYLIDFPEFSDIAQNDETIFQGNDKPFLRCLNDKPFF